MIFPWISEPFAGLGVDQVSSTPYAPPADRRRRNAGAMLLQHLDGLLPVRHVVAANLGFRGRFDRVATRLAARGGAAIDPHAAAIAFGDTLRLQVDPKRLSLRLIDRVADRGRVRRTDPRFLDGGDWSQVMFPVSDAQIHGEILQICKARDAFRNTSRYRKMAERLTQGGSIHRSGRRLTSIDDLDAYYGYHLALVESIAQHGLLPRRPVGGEGQEPGRLRDIWRDAIERDVGVAIAADGSLLHHGAGRHRLAAALGLGLETIPVEVRLMHAGWLVRGAQDLGLAPHQAIETLLASVANGDGEPISP